ncbi:MAG: hypothetical protein ABIQ97_05040, partial [Lysobacteraceae bacterium]
MHIRVVLLALVGLLLLAGGLLAVRHQYATPPMVPAHAAATATATAAATEAEAATEAATATATATA